MIVCFSRWTLLSAAAALAAALCALPIIALAREGHETPWEAPASEKSVKNPVPATSDSTGRGQALFTKNCLSCHGEKGEGNGPVARKLGFMAADLSDAKELGEDADGELAWKIATGRDPMPAFKTDKKMTDAQIWDLVNYIRTLAHQPVQTKPAGK